MMPSRGMGAVSPSKMPKAKTIRRKDGDKVSVFAKGGKVKKFAGGDLVEDVSVRPSLTATPEYKRLGANLSGSIPLSDEEKLRLAADLSVSKARGEGVRGNIDGLRAEYQRKLGKDEEFGASIGRNASGNNFGVSYRKRFAKGGEVWDTPNPAKKSKPLTPAKKASAKAAAKKAGRPYPNLVDNLRAARSK